MTLMGSGKREETTVGMNMEYHSKRQRAYRNTRKVFVSLMELPMMDLYCNPSINGVAAILRSPGRGEGRCI
jgi:hypothetical protein